MKVLVPKMSSCESMEVSRVRIAVITPMTEKTPMLIPSKVRIERNLFCLIASTAIRKLSLSVFFKWDRFLFIRSVEPQLDLV